MSNRLRANGPAVPMTRRDRRWAELAAKRETEALTTIRGLAEKWAASLSGALGVVGLVALLDKSTAFTKLDAPWKTIATISFVAAIVIALLATALAIAAAQGSAKRYFISSGSSLRQYSQQAVDKALSRLMWSRIAAGVAAALILIAGGFLWFGGRVDSQPTVIELPVGSEFCVEPHMGDASSKADFQVRCVD